MRDIRADLKERLTNIETELVQLKLKLAHLEESRHAIHALLESESKLWNVEPAKSEPMATVGRSLSELAMDLFAMEEEWSGEAIAGYAVRQGYNFHGKSPKRCTHSTLMGMARSGTIESLGSGRWRLSKKHQAPEIIEEFRKEEQLEYQ